MNGTAGKEEREVGGVEVWVRVGRVFVEGEVVVVDLVAEFEGKGEEG